MAELIVGIDLGTTNSEIAIVRNGQPVVLEEDGDPILPSCVGFTEDGRLLVGRAARNQWVLAPERTIKSIKRLMGQDVRVQVGTQSYTPQEISAMILRTLKERAERVLGQPVRKAVITVPAFFNDSQRQATRQAGELAGLEVVRILNEPTAAALTYNPSHSGLERILVYDLGGGTFDVSIVQSENGVVEVLASHGDTRLGGDDFDDLLLQQVANRFQEEHGVDLRANRVSKSRLLRAVEQAKKHLSDHPYARIEEEFIAEKDGVALHLNQEISREQFENLIRPLLDKTMTCLQQSLDDARLSARQIDQVILVGGSTRSPIVAEMLEQRLGKPAQRKINPDLCVAMGAAIQGAIIAGEDVGAVLIDITPHSLGIKCLADNPTWGSFPFRFAPILHRNTPLPASRSEAFRTVTDNQRCVEIDIYQGESDDIRQNHPVGRFLIEGLAPVPAGNQILVQLDLTLDGTLKVSAREKATGLAKQITIDNALSRYERENQTAAMARLDALFARRDRSAWLDAAQAIDGTEPWDALENDLDPADADDFFPEADDDADADAALVPAHQPRPTANASAEPSLPELAPGPREGQREIVQARALLEKSERLRERVAEEDRAELDKLTDAVRSALESRDWPALDAACNALADALFYLEDA